MSSIVDPILSRFRAALHEVYGERIKRVVLFGSRACGDARPDSDYDVAVFLKDLTGFGEEMGKIAEIETDILYDTRAVINALPLQAGSYRERTGLMQEPRRPRPLTPEAADYLAKARGDERCPQGQLHSVTGMKAVTAATCL